MPIRLQVPDDRYAQSASPTAGTANLKNFYLESGGGTFKVHGANDAGVQQGNPEIEINFQSGAVLDGATGGDQGAGTINTKGVFVNGAAVAAGTHTHAAADITSGTLADARVAQSNVTQHQAAIDHDALANFSADEHRTINDAGSATTDLWSASKITTELAGKSGTTHVHIVSTLHTWAISGTLANGTPPGLQILTQAGESITAARFRAKLGAGTCDVALKKNGTTITGATMSVTTTAATNDFTNEVLALNDEITVEITNVSSAADLSLTLEMRIGAAAPA